jgi:hypothetical protein
MHGETRNGYPVLACSHIEGYARPKTGKPRGCGKPFDTAVHVSGMIWD